MNFAALRFLARSLVVFFAFLTAAPLAAQDQPAQPDQGGQAWVQIEAQPDQLAAQERAGAWAAVFPDVQGYSLGADWYGIALGPYDQATAEAKLRELKRENLIPRDSFIADGSQFGAMFWPEAGAAPTDVTDPLAAETPAAEDPLVQSVLEPDATANAAPEVAPEPVIPEPVVVEETPEEARAAESELTQEQREELQAALAWYGFYDARIDGSFGRGTRASMAAWQEAQGFEPTGVLTTKQRDNLTAAYQSEQSAYRFETITEDESGIEVTIPGAMVAFDHYEPPFVHFKATDGSQTRLILISSPGEEATLSGLYDTLQTLEIMPSNGPRELTGSSFTLRGESADLVTVAEASAKKGAVKGWMLSYAPADAQKMERVISTLQASFRPVGDRSLDPGMVPLDDTARQGLMAGLEVKHPKLSRTGFYADADGAVVTTVEAVAQCGRIVLDGVTDATVAAQDAKSGVAVLKPSSPLAPSIYATFPAAAPAPGGEVAVAGYSYEDKLSAPVLTFGTLAEAGGLDGETGVNRLAITTLAGDAGGPVLGDDGSVLGMLLPRPAQDKRVLPEDVAYAVDLQTLAAQLGAAGVTPAPATAAAALTPEALSQQALGMTVLVSCYE